MQTRPPAYHGLSLSLCVCRSQSVTRGTDGKKVPKPDTVTRAPTAFQLYTKDHFKRVMSDNPEVKALGDRLKLVRTEWLNLDKDVQAPYEQKAAQLKAEVSEKRVRSLSSLLGHTGAFAGCSRSGKVR